MTSKLRIHREYEYAPRDIAVAFYAVTTKFYGTDALSGVKLFGIFERKPLNIISVATGLNERTKGVMGPLRIKNISAHFDVCIPSEQGPQSIIIASKVKPAEQKKVEQLLDFVKDHLDAHSIYRGKAFTVNGEFLDLSGVSINDVVYNEKVWRDFEAHVLTFIEEADLCAGTRIGINRKVVFEGKYGSGKTLAALLTAQIGAKNGWAVIYLPPTHQNSENAVQQSLSLAKKYQRSIFILEDVDREQRAGNAYNFGSILTAIDGLESKNAQILTIMTTNNIDKVNEAMQRPGRIDKIISFNDFTAKDIERLLTLAIPPGWLGDGIDWNEIYKLCEGYSQSFVLEVGKSGMLFAVNEWRKTGREGKPRVKENDLIEAARDLQAQHKKANERFGFKSPK